MWPAPKPRKPSSPLPKVQVPSSITKRCERDGSSGVGGGSRSGAATKSSGASIHRWVKRPTGSPIRLRARKGAFAVGAWLMMSKRCSTSWMRQPITFWESPGAAIPGLAALRSGNE